jgi:hypothetical protein
MVSCLAYSAIRKTEAILSSETSGHTRTTYVTTKNTVRLTVIHLQQQKKGGRLSELVKKGHMIRLNPDEARGNFWLASSLQTEPPGCPTTSFTPEGPHDYSNRVNI